MCMPHTIQERVRCIAIETARMSYSNRMGQVVHKGTKSRIQSYFEKMTLLKSLLGKNQIKSHDDFDNWHHRAINSMGNIIGKEAKQGYCHKSVAAKFLNVFLHQLVKYPEAHHLLEYLHLPLDGIVFKKLKDINSCHIDPIRPILQENASPYKLQYHKHILIQKYLLEYVTDFNTRARSQMKINRIHLNWLWAMRDKKK